jgi:hypothetical protein
VLNKDQFEAFVRGYLDCALWSSTDESRDDGGDPLDKNYDVGDFTRIAVRAARSDCYEFVRLPGVAAALDAATRDLPLVAEAHAHWARHGHDFWLTRNRHGAGFWDRGYPRAVGDLLTDAAHSLGEAYVCVRRGRLNFG